MKLFNSKRLYVIWSLVDNWLIYTYTILLIFVRNIWSIYLSVYSYIVLQHKSHNAKCSLSVFFIHSFVLFVPITLFVSIEYMYMVIPFASFGLNLPSNNWFLLETIYKYRLHFDFIFTCHFSQFVFKAHDSKMLVLMIITVISK